MVINNITILRAHLNLIYGQLTNMEKHDWAKKARYSSYKGLYKYVTYINGNRDDAYPRVVNALKAVIGDQRFNNLFQKACASLGSTGVKSKADENRYFIENTTELKVKFVKDIFECDDTEVLEAVRQNLEVVIRACNNQLERLNIENQNQKKVI